jgi:threonine 3-dehydrogenase
MNKWSRKTIPRRQWVKALRKLEKGPGLSIEDIAVPEIGPHDCLIEIDRAAICGTDLHIYEWDPWSAGRIKPPVTTGHEFMGRIVELGKEVTHLPKGMRVTAEGHIICGYCKYCRTGNGHVCENVKIIGVDREGAFTRYLSMPAANIWPIHEKIDDKYGSIFDPLGNAVHSVRAQDIAGKNVLITGAGSIGLFSIPVAKAFGATKVIVVEPVELKRKLAYECGADLCIDPSSSDAKDQVLQESNGIGPEILIEMSGNQHALRFGLEVLQNGGEAALLGIPSRPVELDVNRLIIFKSITIRGINGRLMFKTWYDSEQFLLKHASEIDPILTHTFPITEFEQGFQLLKDGKAGKISLTLEDFHE